MAYTERLVAGPRREENAHLGDPHDESEEPGEPGEQHGARTQADSGEDGEHAEQHQHREERHHEVDRVSFRLVVGPQEEVNDVAEHDQTTDKIGYQAGVDDYMTQLLDIQGRGRVVQP